MRFLLLLFICITINGVYAQVYQGLVVPDNKGRFGDPSDVTQASGLALDPNGLSFWTHNDQGNPSTQLFKFLPTTGNQQVVFQKQVNVLNTTNLDWEDLAKDQSGNIYICQVGKNCNANSDPLECPTRYIFKIHKVPLASLNHPDSTAVTPETFYFRYPLTGYDVNNCDADDTVFVNCEAAIWHNGAMYFFTKNIWSKSTNNCGGWQTGYTYMFKLDLATGSSMQSPLTAQYISKYNLKVKPGDVSDHYLVTAGAISPDGSILSLVTYRRVWQFRNFSGDSFFGGSALYTDYSLTGLDTISRAYEGVEFNNNRYITLCVDNTNGRVSGMDLDQAALWVKNTNDTGPGSLRHCLLSASEGDTVVFIPSVIQDTINITSSALTFPRNVHIVQPSGMFVYLKSFTTPVIQIPVNRNIIFKNIQFICGNHPDGGIINDGTLTIDQVTFHHPFSSARCINNSGHLFVKGLCQLKE